MSLLAVILMMRARKALFIPLLVISVASALVLDFAAPEGFPDRQDPFETTDYVNFLEENSGYSRVMGSDGVLMPNFGGVVGLHDVRFVNSITVAEYQNFVEFLTGHSTNQTDSSALQFTGRSELLPDVPAVLGYHIAKVPMRESFANNLSFYSMLGVKYLVTPQTNEYLYTDSFGSWIPVALPNWVSGQRSDIVTDFNGDSLESGTWKVWDERVGSLGVFSDKPQPLTYQFTFDEPIDYKDFKKICKYIKK